MQLMKRLYGVGDFYRFISDFVPDAPDLIRAKKSGLIPADFRERILLAVIEVNGCKICSQLHTKRALESGLSDSEISEMLSGGLEAVPEGQGVAVMFAQHYADSAGRPSGQAYDNMLQKYGAEKTRDIMAFIRLIMVTNVHGNAIEAFKCRIKRQPEKESHFYRELIISLGFPFMLVLAAGRELVGRLVSPLRYQRQSF